MTLVLLLVTLVVFNGTQMFFYVRVKAGRELDLASRLLLLSGWARAELRLGLSQMPIAWDFEDLPWLEEASEDDREALRRRLRVFAETLEIERVIVYDSSVRVKLDSAGLIEINEENPHSVVDVYEIEQALAGETLPTLSYEVQQTPFMRAYTPLIDDSGEVVGLLSVEGQRTYFEPMQRLRNLMLLIGGGVSLAMVVIALIAHGALRRFVRLEEAVAHADRLQTLGTLAAGMAHEIRNPLGIIRVTAETLREEIASSPAADPERDTLCQDILEEVDRVHGLVGRFLEFSQPEGHTRAEPADIADVVEHAVRLSRKATRGRLAIEVQMESGVTGAQTPLPAASLQQVLFNLLRNAQEATEETGGSEAIGVRVALSTDARGALIEIWDRGVGMNSAQVRRAGEPFVTTKPGGTGLGLSITKNLLASVQGRLDIVSRPGGGTTVTVALPLVRSPDPETEETEP
jgi:signal transduction histidine kinase